MMSAADRAEVRANGGELGRQQPQLVQAVHRVRRVGRRAALQAQRQLAQRVEVGGELRLG